MKPEFTALDIYKALNIPRERLRAWTKLGFVTPTVPAAGQGIKAIFVITDIYGIELFRRLIERGFKRSIAVNYVENLMANKEQIQEIDYIIFRVYGKDIRVDQLVADVSGKWKLDYEIGVSEMTTKDGKIQYQLPRYKDIANKKWDLIHNLNFKRLREEVDEALEKL